MSLSPTPQLVYLIQVALTVSGIQIGRYKNTLLYD